MKFGPVAEGLTQFRKTEQEFYTRKVFSSLIDNNFSLVTIQAHVTVEFARDRAEGVAIYILRLRKFGSTTGLSRKWLFGADTTLLSGCQSGIM